MNEEEFVCFLLQISILEITRQYSNHRRIRNRRLFSMITCHRQLFDARRCTFEKKIKLPHYAIAIDSSSRTYKNKDDREDRPSGSRREHSIERDISPLKSKQTSCDVCKVEKVCIQDVSSSNGIIHSIFQHIKTALHKENLKSTGTLELLDEFMFRFEMFQRL